MSARLSSVAGAVVRLPVRLAKERQPVFSVAPAVFAAGAFSVSLFLGAGSTAGRTASRTATRHRRQDRRRYRYRENVEGPGDLARYSPRSLAAMAAPRANSSWSWRVRRFSRKCSSF